MYKNLKVAVVVPAYNEEFLIKPTLESIPSYVDMIIPVNDGSHDATQEIINKFSDPRISSVLHENNMGVGAAIASGYTEAIRLQADITVVMAADNQMDPAHIPSLLDPIVDGLSDYTKGNRLVDRSYRKGMTPWRFLGNTTLSCMTRIASGYWHITDSQNGYTAISRKALQAVNLGSLYPYYGYCNDLLVKLNAAGMRVTDVAIPARYGLEKSKIRYVPYIAKVSQMLIRAYVWRLKRKYLG